MELDNLQADSPVYVTSKRSTYFKYCSTEFIVQESRVCGAASPNIWKLTFCVGKSGVRVRVALRTIVDMYSTPIQAWIMVTIYNWHGIVMSFNSPVKVSRSWDLNEPQHGDFHVVVDDCRHGTNWIIEPLPTLGHSSKYLTQFAPTCHFPRNYKVSIRN
jgi:hypothetical protein